MNAYYDHQPPKLEAIKNGSYIYRWNIEQEEHVFMEGETIVQWKCDEVVMWAPINVDKIISTVINEMWDINYEQKLLNEYNAAQMGIYSEEENASKVLAYKKFLEDRKNIKLQIEEDCKELNVK